MSKRPAAFISALFATFALASPAAAQDVPLSELLPLLVGNTIVVNPNPGFSHEAHFKPGVEQLDAPNQFNGAIVSLLSTFPIGSSAGGFVYTFDPAVGSFNRTSDTFGPTFAERALTIGRRKFGFGMNYVHAGYDSFEGKELNSGDIKFYVKHIDCCSIGDTTRGDGSNLTPFFEGDVVQAALSFTLKTDTVAFFGTYGVTDRLDLGLIVPIVRVDMDAKIDATIQPLASGTIPIHTFPGGSQSFTRAGTASGIGDVVLRGKYRFVDFSGGGMAAAVDLRLPSGDEANLLGTGQAQAKMYLIGSTAFSRLSPHFNVGYTLSGEGEGSLNLSDEANYTVGLELAAARSLTLTADLIGRTLLDQGRLREADKTFAFLDNQGNAGSVTRREFQLEEGNLNLALGSVGVKFNPKGTFLISANLLFSLTHSGLRDKVTPVIGVDYTF